MKPTSKHQGFTLLTVLVISGCLKSSTVPKLSRNRTSKSKQDYVGWFLLGGYKGYFS